MEHPHTHTHTHTHRSHTHRTRKKTRSMERFLNPRLFILLGAIFMLFGIYSLVASSDSSGGLNQLISSFFTPTADAPVAEVAGTGMTEVVLYFLPAILVLIGSLIFSKNYRFISNPLTILAAIYLFIIQVKISFVNVNFGGCFYPEFSMAVIFLWISTILLLANAIIHRKSLVLILTCVFFYVSIVLLYQIFFTSLDYFFTFILIFSLFIDFVGLKVERPHIHLINFIFAWGFFGLFWLRKFFVNSKLEFLPIFFIFGILFFILFYGVILYTAGKKENSLPRWMQLFIFGTNLLAYLGTTSYVLVHYYTIGDLAPFVVGLLLFHILGLYLIKRYNSAAWTLPHHYAVMVLTAMVLPLLVEQGRFILFTGVLSVLMLGYAVKYKRRTGLWVSLASLVLMFAYYLFVWIHIYLPLQLFAPALPDRSLLVYGLLMGVVVTGALWLTSWQVQKATLPISGRSFNKLKYERMVRIGMLFSLFLTMGWGMFIVSSQFTNSLDYTTGAWFISGALFFIGAIYSYRGRVSSFKRPILYMALLFALLYPFLVHRNMIIFRTSLVMMSDLRGSVLFLHYLALALVLILGRMVLRRIYRQQQKKAIVRNAVELLTALSLLFLFCTEYDNLSVILGVMQNTGGISGIADQDQLTLNKFLPYSVMLGIVSVVMFVRSVIRQNRFLRNFAIILYCVMLVKLFVIDFGSLSAGARTSVFLVLGLFLIGFAFIYPKLLKGEPIFKEFKRGDIKE